MRGKIAEMKKKRSKRKWIVLLIITCISAISVYRIIDKISNITNEVIENMNTGEIVNYGNIQNIAEGTGKIVYQNKQKFSMPYNCIVDKVYKKPGDFVKQGDLILELSSQELEDEISDLQKQLDELDKEIKNSSRNEPDYINSILIGKIKFIYANSGDAIQNVMDNYGALMVIAADRKLKTIFESTQALALGENVEVINSNTSAEGIITSAENGIYTVVYENQDEILFHENVDILYKNNKIGSGIVECNQPYYVTHKYGVIDRVCVNVNDVISNGTRLFEIKDAVYSDVYGDLLLKRNIVFNKINELIGYKESLLVYAPFEGVINGKDRCVNEVISAFEEITSVSGDESYEAEVYIDELDIAGIKIGMDADVFIDAFPKKTLKGTVKRISYVGDIDGITKYSVIISLGETDNLLDGMSLSTKIIIDDLENVLLIPLDSIYEINGKYYVDIIHEDKNIEKREIEVGMVNSNYAQVISGVNKGEVVKVSNELTNMMDSFGISFE